MYLASDFKATELLAVQEMSYDEMIKLMCFKSTKSMATADEYEFIRQEQEAAGKKK